MSSMDSKGKSSAGGIGFCSILFIVFLVLRLCHVIEWSWWWVTAPLWGPVALAIVIVIIWAIVIGIIICVKKAKGEL